MHTAVWATIGRLSPHLGHDALLGPHRHDGCVKACVLDCRRQLLRADHRLIKLNLRGRPVMAAAAKKQQAISRSCHAVQRAVRTRVAEQQRVSCCTWTAPPPLRRRSCRRPICLPALSPRPQQPLPPTSAVLAISATLARLTPGMLLRVCAAQQQGPGNRRQGVKGCQREQCMHCLARGQSSCRTRDAESRGAARGSHTPPPSHQPHGHAPQRVLHGRGAGGAGHAVHVDLRHTRSSGTAGRSDERGQGFPVLVRGSSVQQERAAGGEEQPRTTATAPAGAASSTIGCSASAAALPPPLAAPPCPSSSFSLAATLVYFTPTPPSNLDSHGCMATAAAGVGSAYGQGHRQQGLAQGGGSLSGGEADELYVREPGPAGTGGQTVGCPRGKETPLLSAHEGQRSWSVCVLAVGAGRR